MIPVQKASSVIVLKALETGKARQLTCSYFNEKQLLPFLDNCIFQTIFISTDGCI